MKRTLNYILKSSQIVLIAITIFSLTTVNYTNGLDKVSNESMNKTLDLTAMATKYDEILLSDINYPIDTFTGDLTGYSADCPLCSGYLGCTGQYVKDGTVTYPDTTYGIVRIVASSRNLPCGSVVRFNLNTLSNEPVYAIVLDRGVLGNDLDLLMPNSDYATRLVGRRRTTYDVLRYGWTR